MNREDQGGDERYQQVSRQPPHEREDQQGIRQMNQYVGEMKADGVLAPQGKVYRMRDVAQRAIGRHQQARQIRQAAQQMVVEDNLFVIEDKIVLQTISEASQDGHRQHGDGNIKLSPGVACATSVAQSLIYRLDSLFASRNRAA